MDRWVGRVAIVTGASSGIGAAIAKLLAEQGMKVVGAARRVERVQALVAEIGKVKGELHAIQCDVTKEEDVIRVVQWTKEKLGGVDVLVNNAGVSRHTPLTKAPTANFSAILDTNVIGLCMFTREALKCMKSRDINDGHIFNINSVMGQSIIDFPAVYVYGASKHAVTVLTEGLRRELRDLKSKIKVTSISPGMVKTEIIIASGATEKFSEQMYAEMPCLDPIDVANALLYALSTPPHVQVHELTIKPVGETV